MMITHISVPIVTTLVTGKCTTVNMWVRKIMTNIFTSTSTSTSHLNLHFRVYIYLVLLPLVTSHYTSELNIYLNFTHLHD